MSDGKDGRIQLRDLLRIDVPKLHAAFTRDSVKAHPAARLIMRVVKEPRNHRQLMRVLYCPPLPLFWGFGPDDGSDAWVAHRVFVRALWKNQTFGGRVRLLAYYLAWPPIVFGVIAWMTLLNGREVRRRCGKGSFRQMRDQLRLAARHAILPPWYYMFELYDDELLARAGQYLTRDETKGGIYRLLGTRPAKKILQNKGRFAHHCHIHGVRTPDTLEAKEGVIRTPGGQPATSLPKADLFAKPGRGRGGRGAEKWHFVGSDDRGGANAAGGADGSTWTLDGGPTLDEAALLEHFRELTKSETYLIQPRLSPHRDLADLSGNVLTTVRMVTIVNETGGCEATHAVFRMPNGPEANVDNFHAGGLAAKVDNETGELGPGTDMGLRPNSTWHKTHPYTGAPLEGRKLPYWKEAIALACHAHSSITDWTVIGWDIAVCDDGPVIIEGNCGPDLDIIQRAHREPMGDSRFGELLAHHLRRLDIDARLKLPA